MTQTPRLIVLTGCSRGIGAALAHEFDRLGHTVVGCSRREANITSMRGQLPGRHHFSVVDVADPLAVEGWARVVLHELGTPDLLINNAAVINDPGPIWEVAADEVEALFSVNVGGLINVLRAYVPAMRDAARGVIVNLSSGAGRTGIPGMAPYCGTKWAVEGITKSLAQEIPATMAAVPLSPGTVDTDMLRQVWGNRAREEVKPSPWARLAAPFILGLGPDDNGQSLTIPRD